MSDQGKLSPNELEHLAAVVDALLVGPPKRTQTKLSEDMRSHKLSISQAKISEIRDLSSKTSRETRELVRQFDPQLFDRLAETFSLGTARARRFALMEKTYPERGRMLDRFDGMFPETDFEAVRQRLLTVHPPAGKTWTEAQWAKRFWHFIDAIENGTF